jgi:NADH-quinone oxidoreductase subunit F
LAVAASATGFFQRENCGQCPPCAVGTQSLDRIFKGMEEGTGRGRDLHDLSDVAGFMTDHGYCAHCRTAAAVATGFSRRFGETLEAHIGAGGCPRSESRHPDPFAAGSPEREAVGAAVREQFR